jgi:PPOX class probable FMN-dependent enzyme
VKHDEHLRRRRLARQIWGAARNCAEEGAPSHRPTCPRLHRPISLRSISSADADGYPDASPRGDAPGFVAVIDEYRLHLPDRPGNNRLDSFQNLVANPRIALLFLVPDRLETLRVNGTASLLTEPALLERHAFRGKPARAVVEITAKSVYFQCGKAVILIRSGLWQKERWPSLEGLAPFAEAISEQVKGLHPAMSEAQMEKAYRETLY